MMKGIFVCVQFILAVAAASAHPHFYSPYETFFRYVPPYYSSVRTYAQQVPYSQFVSPYADGLAHDKIAASYLATPDFLPDLNVLAEQPYSISNSFTTVPMLLMSKENMNVISKAQIMGVSTSKPVVTVKTDQDNLLQCTPAVRIVLDKAIVVYSLKSSVLFPSEIQIAHGGFKIPIRVGVVIAPIQQDTFVSPETPVAIKVVYAVPTRPVTLDYVNNDDAVVVPDAEAVVVESQSPDLPPKNVTILNFPDREAEPTLEVDEEDEELVNRNPPLVLAPAGIVQSTQPQAVVEPFINSKESPVLISLREEANRKRL